MKFLTETEARKRIEYSPLRQLLIRMSQEDCPMLRNLEEVMAETNLNSENGESENRESELEKSGKEFENSEFENKVNKSHIEVSIGSKLKLEDKLNNN